MTVWATLMVMMIRNYGPTIKKIMEMVLIVVVMLKSGNG